MMNKYFSLFFLLFLPQFCFSQEGEIHNCNGRWTNLACDKLSITVGARKVLTPDEAKNRSQKESILHKLRMKSIEANRKYDVNLDITGAENSCNANLSGLEDCRKEAERLDEKLDKKINSAALLKQREAKIKQPAPFQTPGQTTIIIRDRYPVFRRRVPYGSDSTNIGNGQVLQGNGQQIQQNVFIQQPPAPAPVTPVIVPPQRGGSADVVLP